MSQTATILKAAKALVGIFVMLSLLFVYQNCGAPEGGSNSSSSTGGVAGLAFDVTVDRIAYMSCADMDSSDDAYFTFKIGAYGENFGLKFNESYASTIGNIFVEEVMNDINSGQNIGVTAEVSIRQSGAFQSADLFEAISNVKKSDNLSGYMLSDERIIRELYDLNREGKDGRLRYFNTIDGLENRHLSGVVNYLGGEYGSLSSQLVSNLSNGNFNLMLTYGSEAEARDFAFSPDGAKENSSVYGRVFKTNFISGVGNTNRILSEVSEYDATNSKGRALKNWTCDSRLRLKIVRWEDLGVGKTGCLIKPDMTQAEVTYAAQIASGTNPDYRLVNAGYTSINYNLQKIIRETVDPDNDDWYIDISGGCLIPKQKSNQNACYLRPVKSNDNPNGDYQIQYSGNKDCFVTGSNGSDYTNCLHYISICTSDNLPF